VHVSLIQLCCIEYSSRHSIKWYRVQLATSQNVASSTHCHTTYICIEYTSPHHIKLKRIHLAIDLIRTHNVIAKASYLTIVAITTCHSWKSMQHCLMWRGVLDTALSDVAICSRCNFMWCGELYWTQLYVTWRVVLDTTLCDVACCTGYNFIWCGELYWI
jgi:hypothetical protein